MTRARKVLLSIAVVLALLGGAAVIVPPLLFSDGVTDAQSVANKPFRMKGIHALLEQAGDDTPAALGQRLVQSVQLHAHGGPQYDDITLICFGRPGK